MGKRKKSGIQKWAEEDRPREKLMHGGPRSLSTSELIAILIGSGNKQESAVELSRRILNCSNNNLNELGEFSVRDLKTKFKGIGDAKAVTIIAALELGRRRKEADINKRALIRCSRDIFNVFHSLLVDLTHEEFWILLLNKSNGVIHKAKISQGGLDGTVVDVKIILKMALEKLAIGIVLCHNHPSGNLNPSKQDIDITKKIKNACNTVDIVLHDHLIVSNENYYSFADEGELR
jgi:DNA repair protein RadC